MFGYYSDWEDLWVFLQEVIQSDFTLSKLALAYRWRTVMWVTVRDKGDKNIQWDQQSMLDHIASDRAQSSIDFPTQLVGIFRTNFLCCLAEFHHFRLSRVLRQYFYKLTYPFILLGAQGWTWTRRIDCKGLRMSADQANQWNSFFISKVHRGCMTVSLK